MRRQMLRAGLFSVLLLSLFAGPGFAYFDFPQVRPTSAEQVPVEPAPPADATATATATETSQPLATPVPTATRTAVEPTATQDDGTITTATATATATKSQSPSETTTPTVSPKPTATPVEPVDAQDPPGSVVEAMIDSTGGHIGTRDQRIGIDVPPDAVTEPTTFRITSGDLASVPPQSPNSRFVGLWSFEAATVNGAKSVTSFQTELNVTVRFTNGDLVGRNSETLRFWTFEPERKTWVPTAQNLDAKTNTLHITTSHFTNFGATADSLLNLAPVLDESLVDLNTGSSRLNIPISVAPGRGGLAPQIGLSYDSGLVAEGRAYNQTGGWVGQGWTLGAGGSISIVREGYPPAYPRIYLSAGAVSGEIIPDGQDGSLYVWRMRDEQYARIRTACAGLTYNCEWTLTDQHGTVYVFGGNGTDNAHRRWTVGTTPGNIYYQLDLKSVTDTLGNHVDYTYTHNMLVDPGCTGSPCDYVASAYLSEISYNGGNAKVHFNASCQETPASPALCMRVDTPRDKSLSSGCPAGKLDYKAPKVLETHRLDSIDVLVKDGGVDTLVRKYVLTYQTTAFTIDTDCPPNGHAGQHKLISIALRDRYDAQTLYTETFQYTDKGYTYHYNTILWGGGAFGYSGPHLTQVNNGFGGTVQFEYTEKSPEITTGTSWWTRQVVTQQTNTPGASQPAVIRQFAYANGPVYFADENPRGGALVDGFMFPLRGFVTVTERDSDAAGLANNKIVHTYDITVPTSSLIGPIEQDYAKHGREVDVRVEDIGGALWQETATTWLNRNVALEIGAGSGYYASRFLSPSQVVTTIKGGTQSTVQYAYDDGVSCPMSSPPSSLTTCFGLQTKVDNLGVPGTGDRVVTNSGFVKNATAWIIVPRYVETIDPENSNALLGCTRYYHDGMTSSYGVPLRGLLTATSTSTASTGAGILCNDPNVLGPLIVSTNVYTAYDTTGNVLQRSDATTSRPEYLPNNPGYGWTPGSVPSTQTAYDTTHLIFPVSQTDELGHVTTMPAANYDFVLGKPKRVIAPTLREINTVYDSFGRVLRWYDNLDSDTQPTEKYTYAWGAIANSTLVETRAAHGTNSVRQSLSCADGFGREYEQIAQYKGPFVTRARTDYDFRGLVAVKASPTATGGTTLQCMTTPVGTSTLDRQTMTYDTLGNVVRTTFMPANITDPTGKPYTEATYSGLTSSVRDERGKYTCKTGVPLSRQLVVREDAAANCLTAYAATTYQYDREGQLTNVTDAAGNVTTIVYDLAGRKTSVNDPDMGAWAYEYDAAGSLISQTDARAEATTLNYDALHRLTSKTYAGPISEPSVNFYYDAYEDTSLCPQAATTAIGQLTRTSDAAVPQQVLERSCFDIRGRAEKTREVVATPGGTATYDMSFTYDALNQPKTMSYPDGDVVTYQSYTQGQINGLTAQRPGKPLYTIAAGAYMTPFGAPASVPLSSVSPAQATTYSYDYRMRLTHTVTGGATTTQDLTLTYDDASNVTCSGDVNDCQPASVTGEKSIYTYDNLNRLTAMSINTVPSAAYVYNTIGNMTSKQEGAGSTPMLLTYTPSANCSAVTRPHAVVSTNYGHTMTYDCNGNLATANSQTYTFDAENRMKERPLSGARERYTYDASGTMVKSEMVAGGSSWTHYVGGVFEKYDYGDSKNYYLLFGQIIALSYVVGAPAPPLYVLHDHLGSTTALLSLSGTLSGTQQYWPYGGFRGGGIGTTDLRFTGQREEVGDAAGLGLYNYKARFYSSVLGRFLSADSIVTDGLNRYAYGKNNPSRYSDPSGLCVQTEGGAWLTCNKKEQIQFFSCAWGGDCDSQGMASDSDLRSYARGVIATDAFKWFVAVTGSYTVHLHYQGKIHDLAAVVHHPITTGTVDLDVGIDAQKRIIVSADIGFMPGSGINVCIPWTDLCTPHVFNGWKQNEDASRALFLPFLAALHLEAGPEDKRSNGFTFSGIYGIVDWSVRIDHGGNPTFVMPVFTQGYDGPVSRYVPVLSIALTLEGGNFHVTD